MGSSSSCISSVAPLNAASADDEPDQSLLEKIAGQPALLSKPVPGLSLLLGGAGQTWVHIACERKQVQLVKRMCEFLASSSTAVVLEALGPYCRRMGLPLPDSAADGLRIAVGMCNGKGQTPLMHACYAGCPLLVKYLLEQGANPWASDRCGCRTALHYAAISGCAGSVAALMQNTAAVQSMRGGARYVDARSLSGMTALHYAVQYERHGVLVELLRHHIPDVNAATSGYDATAAWLQDCGSAATPLHFAAARGNAVCALELLRHYAVRQHTGSLQDPRLARNSGGQQPWQLAARLHPAQRYLALVLQPGYPLPRTMGAGGEEGMQVVALGPPSLAKLAAAALRQKLLAAVEVIERQCVEAAAAPLPLLEGEKEGAGLGENGSPAAAATAGSRTLQQMPTWTASGAWCDGGRGSGGGGGGGSHKLLGGGSGDGLAGGAGGGGGPRGGAATCCRLLRNEPKTATRLPSASVTLVRHRSGGGDAGGGGDLAAAAAAGFKSGLLQPAQPAADLSSDNSSLQHNNHHHNHHSSTLHALAGSRRLIHPASRSPPEACSSRCGPLRPPLDRQPWSAPPGAPPLRPPLERHPFGIPELTASAGIKAAAAGNGTDPERLRNNRGDTLLPPIFGCGNSSTGGGCGGCDGSGRPRRLTLTDCSSVSGCFRRDRDSDGTSSSRSGYFRRRVCSAAAVLRAGGAGTGSSGRGCGSGFGGAVPGAGVAHWSSLADPKLATAAARGSAGQLPGEVLAAPPVVRDGEEEDEVLMEYDSSEDGGGGGGGSSICSVCYARPEAVAPSDCKHGLCAACARELCHGLTSRPLPCPFCRRPVTNFVHLAAPPAPVQQ